MVQMRASGTPSFPCGVHCLRPVQVDGGGDTAGSEGPDPVGQAVAVGDRLGPEAAQEIGRCRRSRPDHPRPSELGQLDREHPDPARRAADQHRVARAGAGNGEGGGRCAARDREGGGGAVVDAVGGLMRLVRRDAPGCVYHHEVGDRAGQGAAEYPVPGANPVTPSPTWSTTPA